MGFEFTIGMPMHIPMHMLMSMPMGFAFLIHGKDYLPNTAKPNKFSTKFLFLNEICGASEARLKIEATSSIEKKKYLNNYS